MHAIWLSGGEGRDYSCSLVWIIFLEDVLNIVKYIYSTDYINVQPVFLCFSLTLSGPFKINGVPLRRVNQSYVIATSTKVDVSAVKSDKFDDKYFSKEAQKKKKKGEGEFFEADKEVSLLFCSFFFLVFSVALFADPCLVVANVGEKCAPPGEEG